MKLLYKQTLIILTSIAIFNSNIVKAQTQFTISDLQKMCEYSLPQMKSYALAQKFTYSPVSDEDEDTYYYKNGANVTIIEKMKKESILKINIPSEVHHSALFHTHQQNSKAKQQHNTSKNIIFNKWTI